MGVNMLTKTQHNCIHEKINPQFPRLYVPAILTEAHVNYFYDHSNLKIDLYMITLAVFLHKHVLYLNMIYHKE